jgi:hypothetical protein
MNDLERWHDRRKPLLQSFFRKSKQKQFIQAFSIAFEFGAMNLSKRWRLSIPVQTVNI